MEELTLKALKASIKSWEKKVSQLKKGEMPEIGRRSCPLCARFNTSGDGWCSYQGEDCPVKASAGDVGCFDTPYHRVLAAIDKDDIPKALKWAKRELKFLKKLVPTQEEGGGEQTVRT